MFVAKKLIIGVLFLSFVLIVATTMGSGKKNPPLASKGVVDFAQWNFKKDGLVTLNGEWEFYWNELLEPTELDIRSQENKKEYLHLPGLWQGRGVNGVLLSAKGYATYRLKIKMKPDSVIHSLLITDVLSVCKVWINGTPVESSGVPGRDKLTEKPVHHLIIPHFISSGGSIDLILQVSNYHNLQGGINVPILLGPQDQVQKKLNKKWISTALMGGALLVMGLYHLVLFSMRRSEKTNLYFGLYCLMWYLSTVFGVSGGFLMATLFPELPWRVSIDLTLLPFGLTIPLLILFYHALFPKRHATIVERVYITLGALYIAYILFTPPNAYDWMPLLYFIVTRTAFVYLFYSFATDLIKKEEGARFLIPGYTVLGISEINEILLDLNIINSVALIPDPYGAFIFILSYSFFISLRFSHALSTVEKLSKKLETTNRRLLNLDRVKDEFLANTSHELKTPLAGMIGISEALLSGSGGKLSAVASENIKIIMASGKRLSNLVNDVLDFSRLKHKDIILQQKSVNIFHVAETVLAVSRELAKGKRLILVNEIPHDISTVYADEERLEQIFFNLVGNAVKFTEEGRITISAVEVNDQVEISIADTGIGIPQELHELIFESFEQVSPFKKTTTGGTGLGLPITRKLVELHRGVIQVDSDKGKGAVFRFTLPKPPEEMTAKRSETASLPVENPIDMALDGYHKRIPVTFPHWEDTGQEPEGPALSHSDAIPPHYHVLVVDDEAVNLHMITSHLQLAGIPVQTAGNGENALAALEEGNIPDVILLDIMMPGLNGYEVCRELRKKHSASDIPVIMLTAKNRIEDLVEGFGAGANDYLTKPFAKDELLARVKTQLKLKKAYEIQKENVKLKKELSMRRQTEHELKLMQHRLSEMLNTIDDAIFALNQSLEISFCNHSFESLTGHTAGKLLGKPFRALIDDQKNKEVQRIIHDLFEMPATPVKKGSYHDFTIKKADGRNFKGVVFITTLELEEELLHLMILRQSPTTGNFHHAISSVSLVNELNKNRQRILALEETLISLETAKPENSKAVFDDLKAIDLLLEKLSRNAKEKDSRMDAKRQLAVRVMMLSVDLWSTATQTTKVELAEASRIWNVYVEKDGYCRTQTLDKYLSEKTLPKKPRWKQVFATANFVLATCDQTLPLRDKLQESLSQLKEIF